MDKLEDLREWLTDRIDGSEETRGEDSLISHFINQIDALDDQVRSLTQPKTIAEWQAAKAPPSATAETATGHARYEYLRTLNPRKFAALYNEALMGVHQFDDLVDRYRMKGERSDDASQPSPPQGNDPHTRRSENGI